MPTTSSRGSVLLTGATGFVGMEVLARFLDRSDRHLYALVRADGDEQAQERVRGTLATLYGDTGAHEGRVTAVAADVERDGLGLAPARRAELAERVTDVVHSAASVSFTLPLPESRRINVDGTRQMLAFAGEARARFAYVSTAYVAGTHTGVFGEEDLDVGQGFRNPYERSKFEAERLVREHVDSLPVQIFRPSIVVGERGSGWTASFNVLYSPLKAFARGGLPLLPARRSAPVDVVPVDYVADAIFTLSTKPLERSGETFHLVAARDATTVGRLADQGAQELDRRPPRFVPHRLYRRLIHPLLLRTGPHRRRRALARTEAFFPYFTMDVRFDDARARARLEPAGVRVSPLDAYLPRLIRFARRADWGRRPLRRGA